MGGAVSLVCDLWNNSWMESIVLHKEYLVMTVILWWKSDG
jgi:hypothetical protein